MVFATLNFISCALQLLLLVHSLKTERVGVVSAPDLAEALSARGYLVRLESGQARECGKACGRQCLEKLQHTYLIVSGSLDSAVTVRTRLASGMFQEKAIQAWECVPDRVPLHSRNISRLACKQWRLLSNKK